MGDAQANIRLKRVYEQPSPGDGCRVLVDRLWPRGLTKEAARVDRWLKDVAPSTELRRWFHDDPTERWEAFAEAYRKELHEGDALKELACVVKDRAGVGGVTLVYGARDAERNHALVLLEVLRGARGDRGG